MNVDINIVHRWINLLPIPEHTKPIVVVDGRHLTPQDILKEVQAGTELGIKAWNTEPVADESLLINRMMQTLSRYSLNEPLFLMLGSPSALTPAHIIEHINSGTLLGKRILSTEHRHLVYLHSLKRRA